MKKLVLSLKRKFSKEEKTVKKILNKLDHLLGLKDKYVEVYLVGDSFMKKNVLSFPAPEGFPRPDLRGCKSLGEIYLNPKYIKEHDEDLGYMLVHGLLHLLGYDHKTKSDRIKMERKEQEIWHKMQFSV